MGDRGNICIIYDRYNKKTQKREPDYDKPVFFYAHWGGENLLKIVKSALEKRWRWSDDAYLARIIFCELIEGSERGETGFGIAPFICDNEHPIIVIIPSESKVGLAKEDDYKTLYAEWSFDEFIDNDWGSLAYGGNSGKIEYDPSEDLD